MRNSSTTAIFRRASSKDIDTSDAPSPTKSVSLQTTGSTSSSSSSSGGVVEPHNQSATDPNDSLNNFESSVNDNDEDYRPTSRKLGPDDSFTSRCSDDNVMEDNAADNKDKPKLKKKKSKTGGLSLKKRASVKKSAMKKEQPPKIKEEELPHGDDDGSDDSGGGALSKMIMGKVSKPKRPSSMVISSINKKGDGEDGDDDQSLASLRSMSSLRSLTRLVGTLRGSFRQKKADDGTKSKKKKKSSKEDGDDDEDAARPTRKLGRAKTLNEKELAKSGGVKVSTKATKKTKSATFAADSNENTMDMIFGSNEKVKKRKSIKSSKKSKKDSSTHDNEDDLLGAGIPLSIDVDPSEMMDEPLDVTSPSKPRKTKMTKKSNVKKRKSKRKGSTTGSVASATSSLGAASIGSGNHPAAFLLRKARGGDDDDVASAGGGDVQELARKNSLMQDRLKKERSNVAKELADQDFKIAALQAELDELKEETEAEIYKQCDELEEARKRIEELEAENETLQQTVEIAAVDDKGKDAHAVEPSDEAAPSEQLESTKLELNEAQARLSALEEENESLDQRNRHLEVDLKAALLLEKDASEGARRDKEALEQQVAELQEKLDEVSKGSSDSLGQKEDTIARLQHEVAERDVKIEVLDQVVAEKEVDLQHKLRDLLGQYTSMHAKLRQAMKDSEANLAEKDAVIAGLEAKLVEQNTSDYSDEQEAVVAELRQKVQSLSEENEALLSNHESEVEVLKENLQEKDGAISALRDEMTITSSSADEELHQDIETFREELLEAQDRMEQLERENRVLERANECLERDLDDEIEHSDRLGKTLTQRDQRITELEDQLDEKEAKQKQMADILAEEKSSETADLQEKLTESRKDAEKLKNELDVAMGDLACTLEEIDSLKLSLEERELTVQDVEAEAERLKTELSQQGTDNSGRLATLETQLKETKSAMKKAISERDTSIENLEQKLAENDEQFHQKLRDTNQAYSGLVAAISEKENALVDLRKELTEKDLIIQNSSKSVSQTKTEWDNERLDLLKELAANKSSLDEAIRSKETAVSERDAKIEKLSLEISGIETKLKQRLDELSGKTKELQAAISEKDDAISSLQEELEKRDSKIQSSEEAVAKVKVEFETERSELKEGMSAMQANLVVERERMTVQLDEKTETITLLQNEIADKAAKIQKLDEDMTKKTSEYRRELGDLMQETSDLTSERRQTWAELEKKNELISALQAEIDDGNSKLQSLRNKISKKEAEAFLQEEAQRKVELLEEEISDLHEKNTALENELLEFEQNTMDRADKEGSLEKELSDWMEQATEWKKRAEKAEQIADNPGQALHLQAAIERKNAKSAGRWALRGMFAKGADTEGQDDDQETLLQELESAKAKLEEANAELKSELVKMRTTYKEEVYELQKQLRKYKDENEAYALKNLTLTEVCQDLDVSNT